MMPIRQNTNGIGLGTQGSLVITQDNGVFWRNISLPNRKAYIYDIAQDAGSSFYGACFGGPVVKFTGNLILTAGELPANINFTWQPKSGPTGGQVKKILKNSSNQIFAVSVEALVKNNSTTLSWDRITVTNHFYEFSDVIIDNTNKIYALDAYQLVYSANGGSTWSGCFDEVLRRTVGVGDEYFSSSVNKYR
jgi:hypothetical protein